MEQTAMPSVPWDFRANVDGEVGDKSSPGNAEAGAQGTE
jgi:hypothetical protein